MKLKEIIKLFMPPIIIRLYDKIHTYIIRNQKKSEFTSTITDMKKESDILVVIGNGPSLNESMKRFKDRIIKYDCIVVNNFCDTDYYQQLQPKLYLLADPAFFGMIDSYEPSLKERVNRFIAKIIEKTKWDVSLIVPSLAIGSESINKIKKNPFIHPYFYNYKDLVKYNEDNKFDFWDQNLISVPAQTCLNTCVWLGIFLRYSEIYVIGADTSWIELLHVDQDTNEVYTIDSHFYGKRKMPLYKDTEGKIPVKLHEELNSISNALRSYWDLKAYADYAGVKVYNASEYSLIDAFERKKISSD